MFTVLPYVGGGLARSRQALMIMGAAHKSVVKIFFFNRRPAT